MNYTDILIGPAEITGAFSLVPQSQACGFVGNPFGSSFAGLDFALGRRIEARRHFCACSLGLHVWVSWKKERRFPTSPTLPLLRTYPRKVDKSKVPQREFFGILSAASGSVYLWKTGAGRFGLVGCCLWQLRRRLCQRCFDS